MKKTIFYAAVVAALCICNNVLLSAQIISTIAGIPGVSSFGGDGGAATAARFAGPCSVMIDNGGNIIIGDENNHCIRKITPSGIITTIAGTGTSGFSGDGGPATAAQLYDCTGVAQDAAGNFFIADYQNQRIRKINTSGIISTIAGTGAVGFSGDGGPATAATFDGPYGICLDGAGNVYVADEHNNRIRKISISGIISTIAGTGSAAYSGDGGPATAAELNWPFSVRVTSSGNIYIADAVNNCVRMINSSGTISTFAGSGSVGYSGDGGQATAAQMASPADIREDGFGNILISDMFNNCIRKVNSSGIITTIAGNGSGGFSGDGGPATSAELNWSASAVTDSAGNLYIADYFNYCIRKVTSCVPVVAPVSGADTVCVGATTTLSNSTAGGTWSSSNPALASVNSTSGLVTGMAAGTVIISYAVTNSCGTVSAKHTIVILPLPNAGIVSGRDTICLHDTAMLSETVSGGNWSSSNITIATVSATGLVTGLASGSCSIIYTASAGGCSNTTSFPMTITPASMCPNGIANIKTDLVSAGLTIYPNPNTGRFIINLSSSANETAQIIITNLLGEKVGMFNIATNKRTEEIAVLQTGIYFVTAVTRNERLTLKMEVEK